METNPFRELVSRCIEAYKTFYDDTLSLDFVKVADVQTRTMILKDPAYRVETKYLRAQKVMEDIDELNDLSRLASRMNGDDDDDDYDERRSGPRPKKALRADKDTLNMRFKAAQERRELLKDLSSASGSELDAVNIFFTAVTAEELARMNTVEINEGSEDTDADEEAVLDELVGKRKEELPDAMRQADLDDDGDDDDDPDYTIDENGDVVEV